MNMAAVILVIKYIPNIFLAFNIHVCAPLPTGPPQQDICYAKVSV